MPTLPENYLTAESLAEIESHMAEMMQGDLSVESHRSELSWDPVLRRHVHTHSTRVWKRFDRVTMEISSDGVIVTFRDENRLIPDGVAQNLSDEELAKIIATTNIVCEDANISRLGGQVGTLLTVLVQQDEPGYPRVVQITINTAHKLVASFEAGKGAAR